MNISTTSSWLLTGRSAPTSNESFEGSLHAQPSLPRVSSMSTNGEISRAILVELLEKYFDAHLYYANWGTRVLMFGFPITRGR